VLVGFRFGLGFRLGLWQVYVNLTGLYQVEVRFNFRVMCWLIGG